MRVGRVPPELAVRLQHVVARCAGGNHDGADLGPIAVGLGGDCCHRHARGDFGAAVRDELLGAVDHPLAVSSLRPRLGRARVGTGLGLGQAEGPEVASREQVREPALLLLLGAEIVDGRGPQTNRRLERDAYAGIRARYFLDCQAQRKKVPTSAAVLLRERQPEQAELPHLADDVVAELAVAVQVFGGRSHHLTREIATHVANRRLLSRQLEVQPANRGMARRWLLHPNMRSWVKRRSLLTHTPRECGSSAG